MKRIFENKVGEKFVTKVINRHKGISSCRGCCFDGRQRTTQDERFVKWKNEKNSLSGYCCNICLHLDDKVDNKKTVQFNVLSDK